MRHVLISGHPTAWRLCWKSAVGTSLQTLRQLIKSKAFDLNCILSVATLFARVAQIDQKDTCHHISKMVDTASVQRDMCESTKRS